VWFIIIRDESFPYFAGFLELEVTFLEMESGSDCWFEAISLILIENTFDPHPQIV